LGENSERVFEQKRGRVVKKIDFEMECVARSKMTRLLICTEFCFLPRSCRLSGVAKFCVARF
jgi:hypothetical protein